MELRRLTFLRTKRLIEYNFLDEQAFIANPKLANAVGQVIGQYDWALGSKKFLSYEYFIGNARSIGSSAQNQFMQDVLEFNALGMFIFKYYSFLIKPPFVGWPTRCVRMLNRFHDDCKSKTNVKFKEPELFKRLVHFE